MPQERPPRFPVAAPILAVQTLRRAAVCAAHDERASIIPDTDDTFRRQPGLFGVPARRLTSSERALLPPALAAGVDFDRVRILRAAHNLYAALMGISVVRGSRIFWPHAPAEATSLSERAHLAHELTHVWQYQVLKRSGLGILMERRYRYEFAPGLRFEDFGAEQQAAIVEDGVRITSGAAPRWTSVAHSPERYAALIRGEAVA